MALGQAFSDGCLREGLGYGVALQVVLGLVKLTLREGLATMPDFLSPDARSSLMSKVRSGDTRPELYVRRAVWSEGFRYRLHVRKLPGAPDLVLTKYRLAVFVHGCFWHQHSCSRAKRPVSNRGYWDRKLDGNMVRDAQSRARLEKLGWSVATVWECDLKTGTEGLLKYLKRERAGREFEIPQVIGDQYPCPDSSSS